MIPITVLHARSVIPESTRRAKLNQKLIRILTSTSELVDNEVRINIVDDYAQKLINSEYNLTTTRCFIIGGLKGYERLLSLSKDKTNPKWRPLHMSASWNSKNRRIAKQLNKTSWYKGKVPVEPPKKAGNNPSTNQDEDYQGLGGAGNHASTAGAEVSSHQEEQVNKTSQGYPARRYQDREGE